MKKWPLIVVLAVLLAGTAADGYSAERTYILNSSYSPPHSTETETGYLDLILKEAFSRAGLSVTIRMLPAERSLQDSNAGIADGEIGRIRSLGSLYPNLLLVDEPIIESRDFVAFSRRHAFRTESWQDLRPYNVAFVRGWKIFEQNVSDTRSLIKIDSTLALFKLLQDDRTDVVLNARIDGLYAAGILGLDDVRVMEPPLASLELYLFLHRKNADLIPALEQALRAMKDDGTFSRLRNSVLANL